MREMDRFAAQGRPGNEPGPDGQDTSPELAVGKEPSSQSRRDGLGPDIVERYNGYAAHESEDRKEEKEKKEGEVGVEIGKEIGHQRQEPPAQSTNNDRQAQKGPFVDRALQLAGYEQLGQDAANSSKTAHDGGRKAYEYFRAREMIQEYWQDGIWIAEGLPAGEEYAMDKPHGEIPLQLVVPRFVP